MNTFYVYLWTIADNIRDAASITLLFSTAIFLFITIMFFISVTEETDFPKYATKLRNRCAVLSIVLAAVYILLPSSENLALIYVLPRIADSKVIQKDLPELYDIAISSLKNKLTNTVESVTK